MVPSPPIVGCITGPAPCSAYEADLCEAAAVPSAEAAWRRRRRARAREQQQQQQHAVYWYAKQYIMTITASMQAESGGVAFAIRMPRQRLSRTRTFAARPHLTRKKILKKERKKYGNGCDNDRGDCGWLCRHGGVGERARANARLAALRVPFLNWLLAHPKSRVL